MIEQVRKTREGHRTGRLEIQGDKEERRRRSEQKGKGEQEANCLEAIGCHFEKANAGGQTAGQGRISSWGMNGNLLITTSNVEHFSCNKV